MDFFVGSTTFKRSDPEKERFLQLLGKHIIIEGIPGCGKSTLGAALCAFLQEHGVNAQYRNEIILQKLLASFYDAATHQAQYAHNRAHKRDQLLQYLSFNGITAPDKTTDELLTLLVPEPSRVNPYALTMQLYMLAICQNHYNEALLFTGAALGRGCSGVALTERSVFGNAVFAALQHQSGGMSDADYDVYKEALQARAPYEAHCVLYLHVPVGVAMHRIKKLRRRESEQTIPESYLIDLEHMYYSQIYHQMTAGHSYVIVINNDIYYDPPQVLNLICARPPPYQFRPEDNPASLTRGEGAAVLQRMCDYYERFLRQ